MFRSRRMQFRHKTRQEYYYGSMHLIDELTLLAAGRLFPSYCGVRRRNAVNAQQPLCSSSRIVSWFENS